MSPAFNEVAGVGIGFILVLIAWWYVMYRMPAADPSLKVRRPKK